MNEIFTEYCNNDVKGGILSELVLVCQMLCYSTLDQCHNRTRPRRIRLHDRSRAAGIPCVLRSTISLRSSPKRETREILV